MFHTVVSLIIYDLQALFVGEFQREAVALSLSECFYDFQYVDSLREIANLQLVSVDY